MSKEQKKELLEQLAIIQRLITDMDNGNAEQSSQIHLLIQKDDNDWCGDITEENVVTSHRTLHGALSAAEKMIDAYKTSENLPHDDDNAWVNRGNVLTLNVFNKRWIVMTLSVED